MSQLEVHVEGIPYSWTEDSFRKHFQSCGDISSVRMPTWHDSGRSKGYGFVSFQSVDSVNEALKLDRSEVDGRWLKVSKAMENTESGNQSSFSRSRSSFSSTAEENCQSLFVKNLPYDASEDAVGDMFKPYGKVNSVRIANENGRSKGFCYVEFATPKAIETLVSESKDGKTWSLGDRQLMLDYGSGKPKAGFHPRKESYGSKFGNSYRGDSGKRERRY